MCRRDVGRIDGRAALRHRHDLVNLEAHRVASRKRVVDCAAAKMAWPALVFEPAPDLPSLAAVGIAVDLDALRLRSRRLHVNGALAAEAAVRIGKLAALRVLLQCHNVKRP